jgi:hypothetical protein
MKISIAFLAFLILFFSCKDEEFLRDDQMPYVYVYKEINLFNQQYNDLRFDRGFVYEPGGLRGLIIYRENATTYRAFERACPHEPTHPDEIVNVDDSGFFMHDSRCGSAFDFFGTPTHGPARRPMRKYFTSLEGHMLFIMSDP